LLKSIVGRSRFAEKGPPVRKKLKYNLIPSKRGIIIHES
jgi:hypothetical protein